MVDNIKENFFKMIVKDVTEDKQSRYFFFVDNEDAAVMIMSFGLKAQAINDSFSIDDALKVMEQAHGKGLIENFYVGCLDKSSNDKLKAYCEAQSCIYKEGWRIFKNKPYLNDVDNIDELRQVLVDYIEKQERIKIITNDDGTFKQVTIDEPVDVRATYNAQRFLDEQLQNSICEYRQGENIKTGFNTLDNISGSLHAGLYVLGAVSSLGKTTFIHQIADQLTEKGNNVLFFSLEQSTFELISKSLSRKTAQIDHSKAISSLDIRYGKSNSTLEQAKALYIQNTGDRLSIIEGNFDCNVKYMREITENFIKQTGESPIVVVDYLQIIAAPAEIKTTDTKAIVDANITELKRISRDNNITVIAISSINRANYLAPIDFESFKGSGGIEYTADVIWGLQLQALNEEVFSKEGKLKDKRERIKEAKAEIPRKIELVCLKNRYGISSYSVPFAYYPQFDLFIEDNDFKPAPTDNPFIK